MAIKAIAINNLREAGGNLYRPEGKLQMQVYATYETPGSGCEIKVEVKTTNGTIHYFPESGSIDKGSEKDGIQVTSDGTSGDGYYSVPTFTLDLNSRIGSQEVSWIRVYIKRSGLFATWYDKLIYGASTNTSNIIKQIPRDNPSNTSSYVYYTARKFNNKLECDDNTNPVIGMGGATRAMGSTSLAGYTGRLYGKGIIFRVNNSKFLRYGSSVGKEWNQYKPTIYTKDVNGNDVEIVLEKQYHTTTSLDYYFFATEKDNQKITTPIYKIKLEFYKTNQLLLTKTLVFSSPLQFRENTTYDARVLNSFLSIFDDVVIRPYNYFYTGNNYELCASIEYEDPSKVLEISVQSMIVNDLDVYMGTKTFLIIEWNDENKTENFNKKIEIPFSEVTSLNYMGVSNYLKEYNLFELKPEITNIKYSFRIEGYSLLWPTNEAKQNVTIQLIPKWERKEGEECINFSLSLYEPISVEPGAIGLKIEEQGNNERIVYNTYPLVLNKNEEITFEVLDRTKIFCPHPHLVNIEDYKFFAYDYNHNTTYFDKIEYIKDENDERKGPWKDNTELEVGVYYTISASQEKIYEISCATNTLEDGTALEYRQGRITNFEFSYVRIQDGKIQYKLQDNGGDCYNGNYEMYLNPLGQSSLSRPVSILDNEDNIIASSKRLQKFELNLTIKTGETSIQRSIILQADTVGGPTLDKLLSYLQVGYRIELDLNEAMQQIITRESLPSDWWKNITLITGTYYWGIDGNSTDVMNFNIADSDDIFEIVLEKPSFGIRKHGIIVNPLQQNEVLNEGTFEKINVVMKEKNENGEEVTSVNAIQINVYNEEKELQDWCNIEYRKGDGFYFDEVNLSKTKQDIEKNSSDIAALIRAFSGSKVLKKTGTGSQHNCYGGISPDTITDLNKTITVDFSSVLSSGETIPSNAEVIYAFYVNIDQGVISKYEIFNDSATISGKTIQIKYDCRITQNGYLPQGLFTVKADVIVVIKPTVSTT